MSVRSFVRSSVRLFVCLASWLAGSASGFILADSQIKERLQLNAANVSVAGDNFIMVKDLLLASLEDRKFFTLPPITAREC